MRQRLPWRSMETSTKGSIKMKNFEEYNVSEIIQMAWADDASFDAIEKQFGIKEKEVITIMRQNLKPASFRLWRKRVTGRSAKHIKCDERSEYQFFNIRK